MEQPYAGRSGDVGGYQVEIGEHHLRVLKAGVEVVQRAVAPHAGRTLADFVAAARQPHLTWGRLPEGDEIIIVADAAADHTDALSYAINVSDPDLSGWIHGRDILDAVEVIDR